MSQKWFQLKCISLFVLHPICISILNASASTLPPLLKAVEKNYSKSGTISAEFSQVNENPTLSQKKISSGKILIKRPNKIRWETSQPDTSLLVSNGAKFWFYNPPFEKGERGQVIERKASQVQTRLANALLSGSFSVKDLKIQQKGPNQFVLIPKRGSAGTVTQATIEINTAKKQVQKVILDHQGGNHTEISLSKIELGKPLKNDLFVFQVPPNTDKIVE